MGMFILLVLAAIALFIILSAVISALHFLFWIAVVALLVFAGPAARAAGPAGNRRGACLLSSLLSGRPVMASGGMSGYGSEA